MALWASVDVVFVNMGHWRCGLLWTRSAWTWSNGAPGFRGRDLHGRGFPSPQDTQLRVELLGHMVTLSNLLRNCQGAFHSRCTISHSHQQGAGSRFLHICMLAVVLVLATLVGMRWHLMMVSLCISETAMPGHTAAALTLPQGPLVKS